MSNPPITPSPMPQPKAGMPKWLIILLVVLLLIVLGCCGGFVTCTYLFKKGVQAATQAAPAIARKNGVDFDTSGNGIDLPASFPSDFPVYTGMKAKAYLAPPGAKQGEVTFMGSATPQSLAEYYDREMADKGWTQEQTMALPSGVIRTYKKDKQSIQVTATVTGTDTTMEVTYSTND